MRAKLTDLAVQRFTPGVYMDERTPAFGIRVGKNRRTWIAVKGTGRTKMTLGHYPSMTLAEARRRALLTLGAPTSTKPTISFPDARDAFLATDRWRPQTKRVLRSNLSRFEWKRNIDKITHEDVVAALEAIKGKSARAHALKDIRTFLNWCVPRYLQHSPALGLRMPPQQARDRILTPEELKAVWNACEGTFGTIVKLLILTGQRKMEIGSLLWSDIGDDTITIRATVAKNGREHTFPIGHHAQATLPARTLGCVFRSSKNQEEPYNGYTFHLKQLQKASKTSGWTLHDLRRSFVSIHAEIGTPIHVAEKLVNHVSGTFGGVAGIYNRYSYQDEMRAACDAYEVHIQSLVA